MSVFQLFATLPRALATRAVPLHCMLCHGDGGPLCSECRALLEPLRSPRPALALAPYQAVHARWLYGFPLDQMVNRFKHQQQLSLMKLWQALLEIPEEWGQAFDAVVPVPLHWQRQCVRGYNQSALLASMLCQRYRLPLLQPLEHLRHHRQQGRNRVQRLQSPQNPFRVRQETPGMRLLVVDDVITTGATLRAVGQCLLQAQAASVHALALCQVPDQANHRHPPGATGWPSTQ